MTTFLLNRARTELPGSSDAGIKQMLYEVWFEFFHTTSAWQEDISLPIVANTRVYELTPLETAQIARLAGILDQNGTAQIAMITQLNSPGCTVTLRDTPNVAQTWTAKVILTPLPVTADHLPAIPDYAEAQWGLAVFAGLLGHMMTQPSKPYSNESLGTYHLKRFRDHMAVVRTAVLRRNGFGTNAWVYPQAFATSSQRGAGTVWPAQ